MLLQCVSVIVAPFGITRIASAVANCSEGPWAVARLPPARAVDARPSTEPHVASLALDGIASPFGLHRVRPVDSRTDFSSPCIQQPPRHQRWRCRLGSASGLLPEASKGTTTRGIGSALFAGEAKALAAIRAVIRSLITPFCRPSPRLLRLWSTRRRGRSEQRNCEELGFAQRDSFSPYISVELWALQILLLSLNICCPGK